MDWQPIETAPKDGRAVILYDANYKYGDSSYVIASFDRGLWAITKMTDGKFKFWHHATHWMPLPEPPK